MEMVFDSVMIPTPANLQPKGPNVQLMQNTWNAMYNDRVGGFGLKAGDTRAAASGPVSWASPGVSDRIRWDGKYIPGYAHPPGTNPFAWVESNPHASMERMKEIERQDRELQAMLIERKKGLGPISSSQAQALSRELYTGPAGKQRMGRMHELEKKLGVDKVDLHSMGLHGDTSSKQFDYRTEYDGIRMRPSGKSPSPPKPAPADKLTA